MSEGGRLIDKGEERREGERKREGGRERDENSTRFRLAVSIGNL